MSKIISCIAGKLGKNAVTHEREIAISIQFLYNFLTVKCLSFLLAICLLFWKYVYACASVRLGVIYTRVLCGRESRECGLSLSFSLVRGVSVSGGIVDRTGHTAPRRVLRSSWNNAEARGSERSTPLCGSWNGTNAFRANLRANSPSVHLRPGSSIATRRRSADVAPRRLLPCEILNLGERVTLF